MVTGGAWITLALVLLGTTVAPGNATRATRALEGILAEVAARSFADRYPADERRADLLEAAARLPATGRDARLTACRRLARDHPDTHAGTFAPGFVSNHFLRSLGLVTLDHRHRWLHRPA